MTDILKTSAQKRAEYFEKMELGEPPVSSEDRLDLATRLANDRQPPDYQTAFMLFDPELDSENAQWLSLMGPSYWSFDTEESKQYATFIIEKAVSLGSRKHVLFLCSMFLYGDVFIEKNLNKACAYFDKLSNDKNTLVLGCDLMQEVVEREDLNTGEKKVNSPAIVKILNRMLEVNLASLNIDYNYEELDESVKFLTQLAREFLDRDNPDDRVKAKGIYNFISAIKKQETREIRVAKRSMIALSVFNGDEYSEVKHLPQKKVFYKACFCHSCKKDNKQFYQYLRRTKNETDSKALSVLDPYFSSNADPDELYEYFDVNGVNDSELELVKVIANIAMWEGWSTYSSWDAVRDFCLLKNKELNADVVVAKTFEYGPFYNRLGKNGLPIMGLYEGINYSDPSKSGTLGAGRGFFNGLEAVQNAGINFKFKDTDVALITEEDIEVVLALGFASSTFQWPSIDVPSANSSLGLSEFREKITDPSWLLQTDFGRTLYTTDVLAGELSWGYNGFVNLKSDVLPSVKAYKSLKHQLSSVDGMNPIGIGKNFVPLVNVNPKKVSLTFNNIGSKFIVGVNHVKMSVDGGYRDKGKTGAWSYLNDEKYEHPQRTRILTESYNDVAFLIPAFERLRQLTAMTYAVNELKKRNFKPSSQLVKRAKDAEAKFKAREKQNREDKYALYLPVNPKLIR